MQFNRSAFNGLLNNIGQEFKWRKSYQCACINPNSGAPLTSCTHCSGKGKVWNPPVDCVAGVASNKTQLEWAKMGMWESGDAVVVIPEDSPMWDIGQFDRATMVNSTDPFSLVLIHGAPSERISRPVSSVQRVFWYDKTSGAIVEGGIPDVSSAGALTWPNGGAPPAGMTYSITGQWFTEFFCFGSYASDRNQHKGMRLPKRVVLRRFDLFGR